MSGDGPNVARTELEVAQQIDSICDAFEHSWKSGHRPHLESYLKGTEVADDTLFVELVLIDIAYRQKQGERPKVEEYAEKYPQWGSALAGLSLPTLTEIHLSQTASAGARLGRYELVEQLGAGGYGVVHRAWDTGLERWVALKLFRTESAGDRSLLHREARAVARVQHPHVVRILDFGTLDNQDFIVFEFVPGGNLSEWLKAQRTAPETPARIPPRRAAELLIQLAAGLQQVHEAGVIHRDLKPANILLDEQQSPKIADFGLARHVDSLITIAQEGSLLGTVAYMSPEQCQGKKATVRSDVHALGVMLYEMLTGQRPFTGSRTELLQAIPTQRPTPPGKLAEISRSLETICLKALQKDPADRYATAAAMQADLERFLRGKEVRPDRSLMKTGARWLRRHAITTGVAAALLTLGALFGGLWAMPETVPDGKWAVRIDSFPPGAKVIVVPIDPLTAENLDDVRRHVLPDGVTPVDCRLSPGLYRIIARLPDGTQGQGIRSVPGLDETVPYIAGRTILWRFLKPDVVTFSPITVRKPDDEHEFVRIPGGTMELGIPGSEETPAHQARINDFEVSVRSFLLADMMRLRYEAFARLPHAPSLLEFKQFDENLGPDFPIYASFDQALNWAESAGGRLLTEAEYEYLARLLEIRRTAGTDGLASVAAAAKIPVEDLDDRLGRITDLPGRQAEWVWAAPTAYAIKANGSAPQHLLEETSLRVLKGGDPAVLAAGRPLTEEMRDPAYRLLRHRTTLQSGCGFRLARDARSAGTRDSASQK